MSGWADKDSEGLLGKGMQKTAPVKHEKDKKHVKPETTGVGEGTAKRNIARKSRDPERDKAQGGGHKGLWRATDDGTEGAAAAMDRDDPNYDSSEDAELVMVEGDGYVPGYRESISGPVTMPLSSFKSKATELLKELFVSEDLDDAKRSVQELKSPMYHYELVKRAISMSLDEKEKERELVSRLLSSLYPEQLTSDMVGKGFERLFETVDDLQLDAPNAVRDVATFLARAVVDEILPPSFLSDPLVQGLGGEVVEHAKLLLSRDHMGARLERVWGPGDGRPVEELKVAIDQLLEEYLLSRQLEEAARCVRELSVPHFHHEIVKRAVVTALDKGDEDRAAMCSLLAYLHANEAVSEEQLGKGFRRLLQLVPDLLLDVPSAPAILQGFIKQAKSDGLLPPSFPEDRSQLQPHDDDDDQH